MKLQFLYCVLLVLFVAASANLQKRSLESEGFLVTPAELVAEWVDPEAKEFFLSRIENPNLNYTRTTRDKPTCPCANIFAPNLYEGSIPQAMKDALEHAQCMWSCVLALPAESVKLQVILRTDTAPGILASCAPLIVLTSEGQLLPCTLAGCKKDMQMYVNPKSVNYYYGLDGNPKSNQYDFVSVALHELGHGFGIVGFATPTGTGYRPGIEPAVLDLDTHLRYKSSTYPWTQNPPASSSTATKAITSGKLFFEGQKYPNIKLHAPSKYVSGSSVYHLDEYEHPPGDPNSLMTPKLQNGESVHTIGVYTCDILKSIGYEITSWEACGTKY